MQLTQVALKTIKSNGSDGPLSLTGTHSRMAATCLRGTQ